MAFQLRLFPQFRKRLSIYGYKEYSFRKSFVTEPSMENHTLRLIYSTQSTSTCATSTAKMIITGEKSVSYDQTCPHFYPMLHV